MMMQQSGCVKKERTYSPWWLAVLLWCCASCGPKAPEGSLFEPVSRQQTGIDFRNIIREDENFNIFSYQYYYNGGGLATGDFNKDGLADLVFTGNMVKNRLYLNQGDFSFQDITQQAGIADKEGWCTGATVVDINQDGWLDLYICRAGYPFDRFRSNLLFVSNGQPDHLQFEEQAAQYGLADLGHATQSAFWDYDLDGDLDLFVLNHSTVEYSRGSLEVLPLRSKTNPDFTNKLFRNDGGHFVNVTAQAGVTSNVLSFSLGLSTSDINDDGWPDLFIANDFNEPDYLFINQQNGTFKESLAQYFDHTSLFSMGVDVADCNNDGLLDLMSLDMLPEGNYLQKMHSGADNYEKVAALIKQGFYKQYSRNMLQLNQGDGTFSEMGQMAGVSNTDWSWAALFFDFDNDSHKDLFVANGYLRDHTDMDFLNFTANEVLKIEQGKEHVDFKAYLAQMPPIEQPNYFFQNEGGAIPRFQNRTADWGLQQPGVSQGCIYVDLDNDGDLDLATNNSGDYASVYRNRARELYPDRHYLRLQLSGPAGNPMGVGARVRAYAGQQTWLLEQNPVRGFQSSVDPILHLGLGSTAQLDSLVISWPGGKTQRLTSVKADQTLTLFEKNAGRPAAAIARAEVVPYFRPQPGLEGCLHHENDFTDLRQQSLLPYFYSRRGPALVLGDVNGDGRMDWFQGQGAGYAAQLWLDNGLGGYRAAPSAAFVADAACEDVDASFLDADADGDLDLYVASGGSQPLAATLLQDRLYLNDGRGVFLKCTDCLPARAANSSTVATADADADGDIDVFVGALFVPGRFPEPDHSSLLLNDGRGRFSDQDLSSWGLGLVTDAVWAELEGGGAPELIVVQEWGGIRVGGWHHQRWEDRSERYFKAPAKGLWQSIQAADLDGDGDTDLVTGNLGLNSQLSASAELPLELYATDVDQNGDVDPIFCYPVQGALYPLASRDDLSKQVPILRKKFTDFKSYAQAGISDILSESQLKAASRQEVTTLTSTYWENTPDGFKAHILPTEAQVAPVYAISALDVDADGDADLLLAGNQHYCRVKLGALNGLHGLLLRNEGPGKWVPEPAIRTGLRLRGDVRALLHWKVGERQQLLVGTNDAPAQFFTLTSR